MKQLFSTFSKLCKFIYKKIFNTPKARVAKALKKYGVTIEDLKRELILLQNNHMCATKESNKNIINILYELNALWGADKDNYQHLRIGDQEIVNYILFYKNKPQN